MNALVPQDMYVISASVKEDDAPAWAAATTYTKGMRVVDDHYIYEAVAENTGRQPSAAGNADSVNAVWATIGVTNLYACLDLYGYTQTQAAEGEETLTLVLPFTRPATGFALLNMRAASMNVTLTDSFGEVVWASGEVGLLKDSTSWWEYWFAPFRFERDYVVMGIPPTTGTLAVTLKYGNRPAVGTIVVGEQVALGSTRYGVQSGFLDYSRITRDEFGNEVWVPRKKARTSTVPVWFPVTELNHVNGVIENLLGAPVLWIGNDATDLTALTIFGRLKDYSAEVAGPQLVQANLDIQGII